MDKSIRDCLNLIKESIHEGTKFEEYDYSQTDWKRVIELAQSTSLLGVTLRRLKELAKNSEELKGILSGIEMNTYMRGMAESRKRNILKEIVKTARDENVPVLLFKGVVLSSLYPVPAMRFSSDTDMYIDVEYRDKMTDILVRHGYVFDEEHSNVNVVKYELPGRHYIELHSKLWSYYKGTKIEVLQNMKLTDKRVHGIFDGVECDTIDYAEQLIFLMFHLCKHLICEHASIRFLTDIMLFFYAHYEEMDLKQLKERMVILDYWKFFSQLYEISVRFLGFERLAAMEDMEPAPYVEKAAEATIDELMLINRDDFDEQNLNQLTYNLKPYLTGDNEAIDKRSKNQKRISYLFPSVKDFPEEYGYVKKCPVLLPVGWIHRIIKYAFDRLFKKNKRIAGSVRMNKVDAKVDRLRNMGLIT